MPPEAETPPDVVEGPRSRFATPAIRVRTIAELREQAGEDGALEDVFLKLVSAEATNTESLKWL